MLIFFCIRLISTGLPQSSIPTEHFCNEFLDYEFVKCLHVSELHKFRQSTDFKSIK